MDRWDVVVIGGGTAGLAAARGARARGLSVALIDATRLGGECLWWTCLPTKALWESAQVFHTMRHAAEFGVDTTGVTLNYPRVVARKNTLVAQLAERDRADVLAEEGIDVFRGRGSFVSPHEVRIGERVLTGDSIVIATGAHPIIPDIPGLADARVLTYMKTVTLTTPPASLIVLGGGAVGCEFAQLFARCGSAVTLVELFPRLLPREDTDNSVAAEAALTADGVTVLTGARVLHAGTDGARKTVAVQHATGEQRLDADEILVAIGRLPHLDGLNLEAAGLAPSCAGLGMQETMQTAIPHIWACGDAAGGPQYRPLAEFQGAHVGRWVGADNPPSADPGLLPHATFLDPVIAGVGLTEEEAQARTNIAIGYASYADCDRARIAGDTTGYVKLIADRADGRLLGAHIVGPSAVDLIHQAALVLRAGLSVSVLAEQLAIYPSHQSPLQHAARATMREVDVAYAR